MKLLIHFRKMLISQQKLCHGDFISYQWKLRSKTTQPFFTHFGSLKGLRMPMGLTGRPNTLQNLMEHVLVGLTWNITVLYLDECIIFSKSPEEHINRLQQVFLRFRRANLKINSTKCSFL